MRKEIEVDTDDSFQRKDWIAERIMWFVLLLFILAGLAGLFGKGGLSTARNGSVADKIEIKYQRFLRFHTKDRIDITVHDIPSGSKYFSLEVNNEYANKVGFENILPSPESTATTKSGVIYYFLNQNARQANITFQLLPDKLGKVNLELSYNNHQPIQISQFIYP